MQIEDDAIIISKKKTTENAVFITLLSKNFGILSGYARISSKNTSSSEIGNLVRFFGNTKSNSKYINFSKFEVLSSFALKFLDNTNAFYQVLYITGIVNHIFKEETNNKLFEIINTYLNYAPLSPEDIVLLEIKLLALSGYGLDLTKCSATNQKHNLAYISPKTGGALSYEFGNKFADKLFRLPKWLISNEVPVPLDIDYASKITLYFLNKYYFIEQNQELINIRRSAIGKVLTFC